MDNNNQSDGKVRHITFGFVLAWIVGVLFGLSGIAMLFQHEAGAGVVMILAALVALPPVNTFVKSKTNFSLSGGLRTTAVIILLVIGGTLLSQEQGSSPASTVAASANGSATTQATAEQPATTAPAPTKMTADALYDAYTNNQVAADAKYKGNVVEVTGVINSIGKDILGNPFVALNVGQYAELGIQCTFPQADESQLTSLSSGESVMLEGTVSGETITIVGLDGCSIVK